MKNENYFIGLDIGTNSVGWACVDNNYNLLRYHGKNMWGARIVDDVNTARDRRTFRSSRRRLERRAERIALLQDIFYEEIQKIDENFFRRMKESFLLTDEKSGQNFGKNNIHILFDDGKYNDKNFFKDYPTIYHLREALVANKNEQFDLRAVYLAIHHIIKYRGNFLYNEISEISKIDEIIKEFFSFEDTNDANEEYLPYQNFSDKSDDIIKIIKDKGIPLYISKKLKADNPDKKTKSEKVANLFEDKTDMNIAKAFVQAITGYSFDLGLLLCIPDLKKDDKKYTIQFGNGFDENRETTYEDIEPYGKVELLTLLEKIYYSYTFLSIMKDKKHISEAKCVTYKKHKDDLKKLKELINLIDNAVGKKGENGELLREQYYNMFKSNSLGKDVCNYARYVKNQKYIKHKKEGERYTAPEKSREAFYNYIKALNDKDKSVIKSLPDGSEKDEILKIYNEIMADVDNNNFLPKLNDVGNGAIPYQCNLEELKKILENQGQFYPFLKDNEKKIVSILQFKRPYYVGVLPGKSGDSAYSWATDESGHKLYPTKERLYPWNFIDKIENDALAESFIKRLSGKCQIFPQEEVLAKCSIRYQAYSTLNELNKIKIYNKCISSDLKKHMFNKLFCKKKNVSLKAFIKALKNYDVNMYGSITWENITGLSEIPKKGESAEFNNGMSSLNDFRRILDKDFNIADIDKYDEIIKMISIFNDRHILDKKIKMIMPSLNEKQIKSFSTKTYKGWGKYSKKFLDEIRDNNNLTILEELYSGENKKHVCYNINELIYDKELDFKKHFPAGMEIDKFNFDEHIKNLYCSPSVKTIIWQAICIVEEIVHIMHEPPKHIYIESTREDDVKKQASTRYEQLEALYKKCPDYKDILDDLQSKYKNNQTALSNDKLFLYYTQQCKCMYSGENLELSKLAEYEIDHIIPQCWIKDNSISNRVLVKKIENQRKSSDLTLNDEIINARKTFWAELRDKHFISKKKYNALVRREYDEKDAKGFIQRQLVETNQIVKEVMSLLSKKYDKEQKGTIHGIKASLSSQFRHEQMIEGKKGFAKIRGLNDMHHAKDAYLTAALGDFAVHNTYSQEKNDYFRLVKQEMERISQQAYRNKNVRDLVNKRNGFILSLLKDDKPLDSCIIDPETGEILQYKFNNILKVMTKNDCIITKKIDEKANASFYDQTIYSPYKNVCNNTKPSISLRYFKDKFGQLQPLDIKYYGGFTSENPEYLVIVEYLEIDKSKKVKKGEAPIYKKAYALQNIPVLVAQKERQHEGEIDKYIEGLLEIKKGQKVHKYLQPKIVKRVYKNQLVTLDGQWVYISSDNEFNNATQLVVDGRFDLLLYFEDKYDFVKIEKDKETKEVKLVSLDVESKIRDAALHKKYLQLKQNNDNGHSLADEFVLYFAEKLKKHYPLYKNYAEKMIEFYNRDASEQYAYCKLSWEEKCDYIKKLLIITSVGAGRVDMPAEYGGSGAGRITNKQIDCQTAQWKSQSVTGLYSSTKKFEGQTK